MMNCKVESWLLEKRTSLGKYVCGRCRVQGGQRFATLHRLVGTHSYEGKTNASIGIYGEEAAAQDSGTFAGGAG
jgi:hypothetical protein